MMSLRFLQSRGLQRSLVDTVRPAVGLVDVVISMLGVTGTTGCHYILTGPVAAGHMTYLPL